MWKINLFYDIGFCLNITICLSIIGYNIIYDAFSVKTNTI